MQELVVLKRRLTLDEVSKLSTTDGQWTLKITKVARGHPRRYKIRDSRVGGHGAYSTKMGQPDARGLDQPREARVVAL
jgi:hypothetical protein